MIFDDKNFFKALENFIFTNEKKYAAALSKFKPHIPPMFRSSSTPVFRGMVLPKSLVFDIEQGEKFVLSDYSSWTDSEKMAIKFVNDPSKTVAKDRKDAVGVIFKKLMNSSQVILRVQGILMFLDSTGKLDEFGFDELNKQMGIEEAEILCDKKIVLVKKDIHKIIKI